MITLQNAKDTVARRNSFDNWLHIVRNCMQATYWDEVAEYYAEMRAQEALSHGALPTHEISTDESHSTEEIPFQHLLTAMKDSGTGYAVGNQQQQYGSLPTSETRKKVFDLIAKTIAENTAIVDGQVRGVIIHGAVEKLTDLFFGRTGGAIEIGGNGVFDATGREFILCAAYNFNGTIIAGYRHADCNSVFIRLLEIFEITFNREPEREYQGFLTSRNRFVSRAEAFKIAKSARQIIHTMFDKDTEGELTSEDLY